MKRTIYDDDHEAFRAVRAGVPRPRGPPRTSRTARRRRHCRGRSGSRPASRGFLGLEIPEEFGGSEAGDYRFNAVLTEELAKVNMALPSLRGHPRRHRGAVPRAPHHRGAEAALAARVLLGRDPHRDRHDRARRRLRPRRPEDHRGPRRRRLGHQRLQDVHHQRLAPPTWCWSPPAPRPEKKAQAASRCSRSSPTARASRAAASSTRSARTSPTPPSCSSRTCGCPTTTIVGALDDGLHPHDAAGCRRSASARRSPTSPTPADPRRDDRVHQGAPGLRTADRRRSSTTSS